jgi:hypothetical protein
MAYEVKRVYKVKKRPNKVENAVKMRKKATMKPQM